jgi:hypothetical protein
VSLAIRDSDRKLALAIRSKGYLWNPKRLIVPSFSAWRALVDAEVKRLKVRIHTGPLADSIRARGQAWTRRDIALADGVENSDNTIYCPLVTHELRHVLEDIAQGTLGEFQAEYVFRVRLRWAYECQGVAAELRWMRAQKALRKNMIARIERAGVAFGKPFPGYNMGRIANLKGETMNTLMLIVDGKAA